MHYGNWSEQTEDVLDGKSCGHELQGNQNKQIRVKEAAQVRCVLLFLSPATAQICVTPVLQRLCEECQASCSGISSKDGGLLPSCFQCYMFAILYRHLMRCRQNLDTGRGSAAALQRQQLRCYNISFGSSSDVGAWLSNCRNIYSCRKRPISPI